VNGVCVNRCSASQCCNDVCCAANEKCVGGRCCSGTCGVCGYETFPCRCNPTETGGDCPDAPCCCPSGFAPTPDCDLGCICIPD
jgi:hypothetical protein